MNWCETKLLSLKKNKARKVFMCVHLLIARNTAYWEYMTCILGEKLTKSEMKPFNNPAKS